MKYTIYKIESIEVRTPSGDYYRPDRDTDETIKTMKSVATYDTQEEAIEHLKSLNPDDRENKGDYIITITI